MISTGARSSFTCLIKGKSLLRASVAVIAMNPPQTSLVQNHGTTVPVQGCDTIPTPRRACACLAARRPDTECPRCENRRMSAPDSDRGARLRPPKGRIGPQRALFDNPVGSISMEEVTDAVLRLSEPDRSQTVASLADDVLDELAIKRTPRAREIVMEAIRLARRSDARPDDVAPAARQAGGDEVRTWARAARFDLAESDSISLAIIAAYNRAHPDRPY